MVNFIVTDYIWSCKDSEEYPVEETESTFAIW